MQNFTQISPAPSFGHHTGWRRGVHTNSAVLFDMSALRLWLSDNGYLLEEGEQG